jgi:hypothetical protein
MEKVITINRDISKALLRHKDETIAISTLSQLK